MIRIVGGISFEDWKPKVPITLGGGCAISDNHLMVYGFPDKVPANAAFTRIFDLNVEHPDVWQHTDWTELVVSVCLQHAQPNRPRAGCALSEDGLVEIAGSGGVVYERIDGAGLGEGSRELGRLTAIREIDGILYACGGGGQVYHRDDGGWRAIDDGLAESPSNRSAALMRRLDEAASDPSKLSGLTEQLAHTRNLADIDGTAADDIYVCGLNGLVSHFDGANWSTCRTPGAAHLNSLHCVSRDLVIVVGEGAVWSGTAQDGFTSISGAGHETFWSVRKFGEDIFAGTSGGLVRFEPSSRSVVVEAGLTPRTVVQRVDSFSEAYLWIITDRHAVRFDGDRYEMFRHPDNV